MKFSLFYPILVIIALVGGLTTQFIWKMIWHPEPLSLVVFELVCIYLLAGSGILAIIKKDYYSALSRG